MLIPVEQQLDLCLRLFVAAVLSALIGYDRERHDHPAGLRTHMLVGIGAALFTVLSLYAFPNSTGDRVAAQIVTGIGFLGAGSIVQSKSKLNVRGMTTAAGIWSVSAIGMACGTGLYVLAVFGAVLIWTVLAILGRMEKHSTKAPTDSGGPGSPGESDVQPPVENKPWSREKHESS